MTKEQEIARYRIFGPGQKGEITYTGMWINGMIRGGFGICQCPCVGDGLLELVDEKASTSSLVRKSIILESAGEPADDSAAQIPSQTSSRKAQKYAGCHVVIASSFPDMT